MNRDVYCEVMVRNMRLADDDDDAVVFHDFETSELLPANKKMSHDETWNLLFSIFSFFIHIS